MTRNRKAKVMFKDTLAGIIEERDDGYHFSYNADYLHRRIPIAVVFPLQKESFKSGALFPFFQGLLPEGWYREIVCRTLKIDSTDDFGLLIKGCRDCIGAVWIEEARSE